MNIQETIAILEAVAAGVHPATGKKLVPGNPLDEPLVIRALYSAIQHLRQSAVQPERPQAKPAKVGSGWSEEEDQELIRQFNAKLPLRVIADKHQRTRLAIQWRLAHLGLAEPPPSAQPLKPNIAPGQKWWKEQGRTQAGQAWTKEEDEALLRDFRLGVPLEELASRLKRGVNAVEVRLVKLGIRSGDNHG